MPEILRAKEIAGRLHVNVMTVYRWARQHAMPHIKVGQIFLFDWNDVAAWLKKKKVNA